MQTAYNALVDGYGYTGAPDPGPVGDVGSVQAHSSTMPHIADLQGMPPIFGDHNIPLHVGMLGLLALAIVVGLRALGFTFSGAVGVGIGGR